MPQLGADRSVIVLTFDKTESESRGKGYWKFISLLANEKQHVQNLETNCTLLLVHDWAKS